MMTHDLFSYISIRGSIIFWALLQQPTFETKNVDLPTPFSNLQIIFKLMGVFILYFAAVRVFTQYLLLKFYQKNICLEF